MAFCHAPPVRAAVSFCTSCGADIPGGARYCPSCGRTVPGADVASAPGYAYATDGPTGHATALPPPVLSPPPERAGAPPVSQGAAVAALLLNILLWPGLGTLVAGDKKGWAQGFLFLAGGILTLTVIGAILGIPMMIAAWVWGIVSGVNLLNGKPA